MKKSYRDLLKHSGIYGIGQAVLRVTSIILLPIYTRYLTPADYGILAILEITVSLLRITMANGLVNALNRHHFDSEDETHRDRLWWSGLTFLGLMLGGIIGPLFLIRGQLAMFSLGDLGDRGRYYFALTLITVCFIAVGAAMQAHLRVYKQSGLLVVLSLVQAALNVTLNLVLLIRFNMGIEAVLWGNLIANAVGALLFLVPFLKTRGNYLFDRNLLRGLAAYGGPLIVSSLLALALHKLDRYWLRVFLDLSQVGIYSVAYAIGQGVNTLLLQPFSRIWYVVIYEVAGTPDARRVYTETFRYYFSGLAILMLGLSLFAKPLIWIAVDSKFYAAADLIPIICLAYLFFSLHTHFNVPALIAKRTTNIIPAHVAALVMNTVANLLLIPVFGAAGAAWASVISFAAFSFVGLAVYRRIDKYEYPFLYCTSILAGTIVSFLIWQSLFSWENEPWQAGIFGSLLWIFWAGILGWPMLVAFNEEFRLRATGASARGRSFLASILTRR